MAVGASRGELGWAKVGSVNLNPISITPSDNPPLLIPPILGNFYPINYVAGITVPSAAIRTNPYADFWSAAQFGTWFDVDATTRAGELSFMGTGVSYYDGNAANIIEGAKADSFALSCVMGGLVDLTMTFMGTNSATAATAAPTYGTNAPLRWSNVSFGTATGVITFELAFSNGCYPSGEITPTQYPANIHAGPPRFTLTIDQKPGATPIVTTETLIIGASPNAAAFAMKLRQASPTERTVAYGETIYRRTFTGMRIADADVPFALTFS